MEQERLAHEQEEKEKEEKLKKIKDQFQDPNTQWEKDKSDIQNEAMKEKAAKDKAAALEKEKEAAKKPAAIVEAVADTPNAKDVTAQAKIDAPGAKLAAPHKPLPAADVRAILYEIDLKILTRPGRTQFCKRSLTQDMALSSK